MNQLVAGEEPLPVRVCARVAGSGAFGVVTFALIVANAAVLGVETYRGAAAAWHTELRFAEQLFMVAFTLEIVIRFVAIGCRPGRFLRDGWNVFDLVVVLAAFVPVVRENATVLRLLRLARVLRAVRMFPQVRVILTAAWKALPGALSFLVVGALVLYLYAMLGWILFKDSIPEHYGSIGRAVLTLFFLMALDGLGDLVREGLEVSRWTVLYFGTYVLISSFLLVNLLIGVVITSLEEAREQDGAGSRDNPAPDPAAPGPAADPHRRIAELRAALDALERELPPPRPVVAPDGSSAPAGGSPVPEPRAADPPAA